ncbi:hypothetical protein F4819DRAFT_91638 [Hypoxylon fuscum]|nr:hypothetical protein F4819DRAFT_91638 [Hypoxylon fuscum]
MRGSGIFWGCLYGKGVLWGVGWVLFLYPRHGFLHGLYKRYSKRIFFITKKRLSGPREAYRKKYLLFICLTSQRNSHFAIYIGANRKEGIVDCRHLMNYQITGAFSHPLLRIRYPFPRCGILGSLAAPRPRG